MNARERVNAYLAGKAVDKIPNWNIIMQFGAQYAGFPFSKYLTDFNYLVESEIMVADHFGLDCVCAISSPFREAEGYGLKVKIPVDGLPVNEGRLIHEYADLKKLPRVVDPHSVLRMNDRLLAVERFKREVGDRYPVIGWIEGPIAEAADLRGIGELLTDLMEEPEFAEDLMDLTLENGINYAKEQIRMGADFIGVGDAIASQIGPTLYEDFVLEREKKLIKAIHEMGARVKLHICGNITKLLPFIAQTGADVVDVDHMVDFRLAVDTLAPNQMANGNYDPVAILYQGTPEIVRNSVNRCLEKMGEKRAMISAGCEVPRYTPYENLHAADEALRAHGAVPELFCAQKS
jgi:MtaA/CmuA family methyltransferase